MDGTRKHHLKQSFLDSEGQKSCFPSYADYRPKTNAVMLLDMGHTLREECTWEKKGKGRKHKT
jgi:hypothetical protein